MTHYPKCKSCTMSRDCAFPLLVAWEVRRQDVDFGGSEYRVCEMEIAKLLEQIHAKEQHQEPCQQASAAITLGELRPEDS